MNLQEFVLNYKDDVVKSIQESVRIKSVQEAPLEGIPLGEGAEKSLAHMLKLGEKL